MLGRISKRGDRYLRMLLTHGARAVLRAASRAVTGRQEHRFSSPMGARAPGSAPTTTRPPARSPTSSRASATPRCVMRNPTASPCAGRPKRSSARLRTRRLRSFQCRVVLTSSLAKRLIAHHGKTGRPTPIDADNSAGSFTPAARNDWRSVRRFHVGTGHTEPTSDAGYTTAGSPFLAASTDPSLACWAESIYSGLADQLVVLGVRPNPEPDDAVGCFHSHRAIVNAHARRVEAPNLLEVKRRVPRVEFELLETAVGKALDCNWQRAIALPELRRGVVNQSFVVRPDAWAFNA